MTQQYTTELRDEQATKAYGQQLGAALVGGEVIELVGDIGAGKTTLVKGIAAGMGIAATVQSPSYTISAQYQAPDGRELHHYDLYRLREPGLAEYDLAESLADPHVVTIIEWADSVTNLLPAGHTTIRFEATPAGRLLTVTGHLAS